jgi:hypothetical protein
VAKGEALSGAAGVRGRSGREVASVMCSCGVLVLCLGVRSLRFIFGGNGDQVTFFLCLGVSGVKVGVMIGDAGKEMCSSGEDAGYKGFCGELGAVSNTSSPLESESPLGRTSDSGTML